MTTIQKLDHRTQRSTAAALDIPVHATLTASSSAGTLIVSGHRELVATAAVQAAVTNATTEIAAGKVAGDNIRLTEIGGRLHSAKRHRKLMAAGQAAPDDNVRLTEIGGRLHSAKRHRPERLHSADRYGHRVRDRVAAAAVATIVAASLGAGFGAAYGGNTQSAAPSSKNSAAAVGGRSTPDRVDTATRIAIIRMHSNRPDGESHVGFMARVTRRFSHTAKAAAVTTAAPTAAENPSYTVAPRQAVAAASTTAAPHTVDAAAPRIAVASHPAEAEAPVQHAAAKNAETLHVSIATGLIANEIGQAQRDLWAARVDFNSQFNLSGANPSVRISYGVRAKMHALEARTAAADAGDVRMVRDANALLAKIIYDQDFNLRLSRQHKTYNVYVSVSTTGWSVRTALNGYSSPQAVNYVNMLIDRAYTLGNEADNAAYTGAQYKKDAYRQLILDDTRGADTYAIEAYKVAAHGRSIVGDAEVSKALIAARREEMNRKFLMKEIRRDEAAIAANTAAAATAPAQ